MRCATEKLNGCNEETLIRAARLCLCGHDRLRQHAVQTPPAQQPALRADNKAGQTHGDKALQMPADKTATSGARMTHEGAQWAHFVNMVLGLWVVTGIFALEYHSTALQVSDVVSGALVILLSLSRGPVGERYGSWQRYIR